MNYDIRAYAKTYPNWVETETCEKIVTGLKNAEWQKHTYHSEVSKEIISFDTELEVTTDLSAWVEPMHHKIWHAIKNYLEKDIDAPWFNSWSGFSQIRYNRYNVGSEMRTHCDHIQTLFDGVRRGVPMLSVLGALNDDYEGGEFIMWENEKIELKAGDIMIFPSNFMYPHKVTPVTKGTRYSYVSWVW